ncbi:MAG: hypothetical protein ABSG82_01320 [Sedimentisphaerales bacterium]|jgi:hypothetical protein
MKPTNRKKLAWELRIVLILLIASLILNLAHYLIFRDLRHIWLWNFTDLAFLPISVLFMTLLIDRLLSARETALRLDKMNMLIGAFFSNVGTELLERFAGWDADAQYLRDHFGSHDSWSRLNVRGIERILGQHGFVVSPDRPGLQKLRELMAQKQDFLMRLLENPNLLEHENFTDLLRAVFHLAEELAHRSDIASTPDPDVHHLSEDAKRAYALLVREWVVYMKYLKGSYPYLFSLAVRTNPLDRTATPVVEAN